MKWKKWLVSCSVCFLALGVFSCGSHGGTVHHTDQTSGKIVIGLDDNYPPVGFCNEKGELIGSDVELAKEAAKRLGRQVEFRPIDWSSKEAELASGKVDLIWNGLTPTPEREKNILFSLPYQTSGQVVFVRKGSPIRKSWHTRRIYCVGCISQKS